MSEPLPDPPPSEEPEFGGWLTLAIAVAPVGFFGVYLLAVTLPGARTWVGALMLSVLAASSYVGVAMVGTRWFDKHRRG